MWTHRRRHCLTSFWSPSLRSTVLFITLDTVSPSSIWTVSWCEPSTLTSCVSVPSADTYLWITFRVIWRTRWELSERKQEWELSRLRIFLRVPLPFSPPCCRAHQCTSPRWRSARGCLAGCPPGWTENNQFTGCDKKSANTMKMGGQSKTFQHDSTLWDVLQRCRLSLSLTLHLSLWNFAVTWMITLRRTTLVVSTSSSELSEDRKPSSSAISWETAGVNLSGFHPVTATHTCSFWLFLLFPETSLSNSPNNDVWACQRVDFYSFTMLKWSGMKRRHSYTKKKNVCVGGKHATWGTKMQNMN